MRLLHIVRRIEVFVREDIPGQDGFPGHVKLTSGAATRD